MPLPKDQRMPESSKLDMQKRQATLLREGGPGLFKEAAKEIYNNPAINTAISLSPIVGDAQAGLEAIASAREGDWTGAGLNAVGLLPFVPALRTVWHGSPHKFDAFDMSKMGTGEGAQAYGHGLYFADAPEVAKTYQPRDPKLEETIMKKYSEAENNRDYASMQVYEDFLLHKSPDDVMLGLKDSGLEGDELKRAQKALDYATKQYNSQTAGALYKVDIPDEHIAKMLDWEKSLSQQPQNVQDALAKFDADMYHPSGADYDPDKTGKWIYTRISEALNKRNPQKMSEMDKQASDWLNQQGVPGIRYFDGNARAAGEGTSNYVVFDDQIPKILERNGNPLVEALRNSK